jgi:hypothetical protein
MAYTGQLGSDSLGDLILGGDFLPPNARLTAEFADVAYREAPPADNARLTEEFAEVGYRDPIVPDPARLTQAFVEVGVHDPDAIPPDDIRLTQQTVEVLYLPADDSDIWTECREFIGLREWDIRLYDDKDPSLGTRTSYGGPGSYSPSASGYIDYTAESDLAAVVSELNFEIQERGGYGSGSCRFLAEWDQVGLAGTERVDVWLWDEPAYRGYLRVAQRLMDSPEVAAPTFYGMVALLDGYQVKRKLAYGCATDIATIFRDLALAYVKQADRFPDITIEAGEAIGVTLTEYDGRGKSVAEAFNELCDLAPAQCIWGVEMDSARPIPGDTLYIRPKPADPAYIYAIGDNVRALTYPEDTNEVANRLIIEGGPVEQPNLAVNGGFEQLMPASESQGNWLLNESFDDLADPSVHWTLAGPDPTIQFPGNPGASGSARTGDHWLELDEVDESASQTVFIVPGRAYTAACWARLESSDEPNAFTLTLEGLNAADGVVTSVYATFNSVSTPALDSAVYHRYTVDDDWSAEPTVVKARITVTAGGGSHADDGVLIDDLGIYETCGVAQETWRAIPTGDATIVDLDWDSTGTATTPPRSGGLCVHLQCDGIAVSADTGELYYLPSKSPSVQARERYSLALWWHVDGEGAGVDDALSIGAVSIDSANNQGTVWESATAIGNPSGWTLIRLDIMTESDTARLQLFIRARTERNLYLDDVMLVQGEVPEEVEEDGGYWTGESYERTIDVEDALLTGMLDADVEDSIALYGEREAPASNELITDLETMLAFASGQFNARSLPRIEAVLEIFAARELIAQAGRVRLINLPSPPPALWPARSNYTISPTSIDIRVELGNQRPDLQSLLAVTSERSR